MPLRLEFLYLGALITIAAAVQGNILAMWLAFAAFALTFVSVRIERVNKKPTNNSSFSLSAFAERKRRGPEKARASRMLAALPRRKEMTDVVTPMVASIAEQGHHNASHAVQTSIAAVAGAGHRSASDAAYIGLMAALGAMIPTAMIFANQPKLSEEDLKDKLKADAAAFGLVTKETMLFTALIAAKCLRSLDSNGGTTIEFGPPVFLEAIKEWESITGKVAEEHLNRNMVESARKADNVPNPFSEFMKSRSTSVPTSGRKH